MKITPHNCVIAPNGFIDGGKYQLINQVYNEDQAGNITTTYNADTHMLDIEVNTTNLEYPIVLDPTISISASPFGGYIYKGAGTWGESHDATTGDATLNKYVFTRVGHIVNNIYRGYMFFDTSSINPSVSSFVSGNISIYGESDTSSGLFDIVIQHNETGTYPHTHLPLTDYNYKLYNNSDLGSYPTSSFVVDGWNYIQLNASGLENITTGYTKYCIRSSMDIANTSGGARYLDYYNCRSYFPPVLTLVWNGPEITNEYPVNESVDISIGMHNHSIQVNDSTGLNMDIKWFWRPGIYYSWSEFGTNTSVTNGTYYQDNSVNYTYYGHPYFWKVCINNSDGIWNNQTYEFTTVHSTPPVISNMSPANGTMFSYTESYEYGDILLSAQINDTEGRYMLINFYVFYDNCSGPTPVYSVNGYNNTYSCVFSPSASYGEHPGVKYWYIYVREINPDYIIDNMVYSDIYWFANKGLFHDHFCDAPSYLPEKTSIINRNIIPVICYF